MIRLFSIILLAALSLPAGRPIANPYGQAQYLTRVTQPAHEQRREHKPPKPVAVYELPMCEIIECPEQIP